MMWKRSQNRYGKTPLPVTPYQKAAQLWDERIGSARVQAKNWRLAALGLLGLCALLISGMMAMSLQSRITPYVVEVETGGRVRAVGAANADYKPTDAQIAHELARFIKNVRSVSIDPVVIRQNWLSAYDYATDQAAITLNSYAKDNDPFAHIGAHSVSIDVTSIVRASADSFEIRWRETEFENGAKVATSDYTAHLSILISPPKDAETIHRNPLGLYVNSLNWAKDLTQETSQ